MISEEIAKAKQDKNQRITGSLIIIMLVSVLSAVLLFIDSNDTRVNDDELGKVSPNIIADDVSNQPSADMAGDRQAYLDAFTLFENTLRPELALIDIGKWDSPLSEKLIAEKNNAIQSFSDGNYTKALQAMEMLTQTAQEAISESREAFRLAIKQVSTSYSANDYAGARIAVDTALIHDAASETALAWHKQVEHIPQIAKLDEAIQVAAIENNLSQELDLIEQLLAIDANRPELQKRASTLHAQQRESRFKNAINEASRAIANRDLASAGKAIKRAKSIDATHSDVTDVTLALSKLESQQRFDHYRSEADEASYSDDWSMAKQKYKLALSERPTDSDVIDKLAKAERIITISADINKLIQNPHRLNNSVVKTKAQLTLIKASGFVDISPSLNSSVRDLKSVMKAVSTPIPVTVLSDGQTFVQVRGLGIIGTSSSKVIELKPGSYKFEGKRDGYKSKIVEVTIPMNKSAFTLTVVADERI